MISLLFSPLGKYIAIGGIILMAIVGAYVKIRSDAIAEIEAKATADALGRVQDAVRAGDAVDVSSGGLLKDDGHRRD